MKEKFNCETGEADPVAQEEQLIAPIETEETPEASVFADTEGKLDTDLEALAGFTNDLPLELDEHSANNFFGRWNIPLDDLRHDGQMN